MKKPTIPEFIESAKREFGFTNVRIADDFLRREPNPEMFLYNLQRRFRRIAEYLEISPKSLGLNSLELVVGYNKSPDVDSLEVTSLYICSQYPFTISVWFWLYKYLMTLAFVCADKNGTPAASIASVFEHLPKQMQWLDVLIQQLPFPNTSKRFPLPLDPKDKDIFLSNYLLGWFVDQFEPRNRPKTPNTEKLKFSLLESRNSYFAQNLLCMDIAGLAPRLLKMGADVNIIEPLEGCFFDQEYPPITANNFFFKVI